MAGWHIRLQRRYQETGWIAAELARRSGVPYDSIQKYLDGLVDNPRGDVRERIADALRVSRLWLKEGIGPKAAAFPIVGQVSAGESFSPIDDHLPSSGLGEIAFDFDGADPIGIEVRGTSMMPVYRPGDVLIGSRRRGADIDGFLHRDCIVRTENDEGYLKIISRGSKPGLYTLESYNRAFEPMEDVRLAWAAPVEWVRRARSGGRQTTV